MGLAGPKLSNSESPTSPIGQTLKKFNELWDRDSMRRVSHQPSVSICLGVMKNTKLNYKNLAYLSLLRKSNSL